MDTLDKIHETINAVAQEPGVNISRIDDYKFKVVIMGNLMTAFEKLGEVEKKIEDSCNGEYTLRTVCGDGQDATFILKKVE